jgi:uncharacterized protein (TIGR02001 family)
MKKVISMLLLCLLVLTGSQAFAEQEEAWNSPKNFSGTVWLTTNYIFRGVTQTNDNPAIQGAFDYVHPLGFYLGVWGSNIDLGIGTSVELDFKGGFARSFGDFKIDVGAFGYTYPGNDAKASPNYVETHLGVFYTLPVEWPVVPTLGVGYNWSPDFFGEDGNGNYVNGLLDFTLPWNFGLGGEVGYQTVAGGKTSGGARGEGRSSGYDYMYYRASLNYNLTGWFKMDLSYHNTSGTSGYFGDYTGPRVVFTVSRTF